MTPEKYYKEEFRNEEWIRYIDEHMKEELTAEQFTILCDTVLVNRIRRSGQPIFFLTEPCSFAKTFALQPWHLQMSAY